MQQPERPEISIIVPVHNYREHLPKYLAAVSKEDCQRIEFIFSFDIDEPEPDLSDFFSKVDFNRKCIYNNFDNPGETRNAGLNVASGDWIVFHDIDDKPEISGLLRMINSATLNNDEVAVGRFRIIDYISGEVIENSDWSNRPHRDIIRRPGLWRFAFRKEVIDSKKFPNASMGEDQLFLLKLELPTRNITFSSENVYNYFKYVPKQLTSQNSKVCDLVNVIAQELAFLLKSGKIEVMWFGSGMILRQIVTLLKRIVFKSKLDGR